MTERVAYPVTEPNLSSETPIDSQLMGFAESEPEYFMPIQELVLGSILSHNLKAGELLELKAGELLASVQIGQGSLLIKSTEAANNFAVLGTKNKLSFPAKVYSMVSEAAGRYPDAIRWVQNGAGFQVCRQSENLETLLRKYFNHGNYFSLQRQLNMYGWTKLAGGPHKGAFFNPQFHQHAIPYEKLVSIQRRVPLQIPKKAKSSLPPKRSNSSRKKSVFASPKPIAVASSKTPSSASDQVVLTSTAPFPQVTPFLNAATPFAKEDTTIGSEDAMFIAGPTSCISIGSAFWRSRTNHYSITPKVQNPRDKRRSNTRSHPSNIVPNTASGAPTYKNAPTRESREAMKTTEKHPAWISPLVPGSVEGVDENILLPSSVAKRGHSGIVLDCEVNGSRIPMTPIFVKKFPKQEYTSNDRDSPMMPAPAALLRRQSSGSFFAPFMGAMGDLSQALDVAYSDHGCNISSSCPIKSEPLEDDLEHVAAF